jgi:threonine aldolase
VWVQAGVVDLRSDTVTIPGSGMRAAMAAAEVGDDVLGEDPTVARLESETASRLGKEAALFVPSGTMGNLICVAAQTRPGDEVIADALAHVVVSEVAGSAVVAGVQLRTLEFEHGVPDPQQLTAAIRGDDIHLPTSRLLCVENTHNRRGGAAVEAPRIRAAASVAHAAGLRVHCDGARLFNAAIALSVPPGELVDTCDSVSVCFSKGLGAPVGSAIAGDAVFVAAARRWRKRLGGGMRQAGVLAAAALFALEHNVERLAEDHANAAAIADTLRAGGVTVEPAPHPTNIVFIQTPRPAATVAAELRARGVLLSVTGPRLLRCVTHLGVDAAAAAHAAQSMLAVLEAATASA